MFLSSYHHKIFRSHYHCEKWCPYKRSRSKVKVTEVKTQLDRFRTIIPVWFHIWWWNDALSLLLLRRGAQLFFMVIRQISRSHGDKKSKMGRNGGFRPLSEKVFTQSNWNLVCTLFGWVFRIDSLLGHVGQILALWWSQKDWKWWFPPIIWKSIHTILFKLGVCTYLGSA